MNNINKVNFFQHKSLDPIQLNGNISINAEETKVDNFKDVLGNMISEMNEVTNKPEAMMKEAMLGRADIHDVMAAVAQSELTVQAATTITGKILQTYEKIMQIQI